MRTPIGALATAALLSLAGPTRAAVINVTTTADENIPNGDCSLREAIQAANFDNAINGCTAGSGTDDIYIPAGTYALSIAGSGEDGSGTGDLDVRSSLRLHGAGAGLTVIDATGLGDRVLHVMPAFPGPDIDVEIRELTLRGGVATAGGGLLAQDRWPVPPEEPFPVTPIIGLRTLWVYACVIEDNSAGESGGGIFLSQLQPNPSWTLVSLSTIRSNTATNGNGGGISSQARQLTLTDTAVVENDSSYSGGLWMSNNLTSILRSTIAGNQAAGGPGGIFVTGANAQIVNSTISGNTTTGAAGGIAVGDAFNSAGAVMLFSTVTGNVAAQGGGIKVGAFYAAALTIGASIVADNAAATNADVDGSFNSAGDNLIGDGGSSSGFGAAGDQVGTTGSPIDPVIGPLADNGGPTQTHALLPGSPAIEAVTSLGNSEDQRGAPRPSGVSYDIGAFELGAAKVPALGAAGIAALALALGAAGSLAARGRRPLREG